MQRNRSVVELRIQVVAHLMRKYPVALQFDKFCDSQRIAEIIDPVADQFTLFRYAQIKKWNRCHDCPALFGLF